MADNVRILDCMHMCKNLCLTDLLGDWQKMAEDVRNAQKYLGISYLPQALILSLCLILNYLETIREINRTSQAFFEFLKPDQTCRLTVNYCRCKIQHFLSYFIYVNAFLWFVTITTSSIVHGFAQISLKAFWTDNHCSTRINLFLTDLYSADLLFPKGILALHLCSDRG